jgi:hypothetical protein
VVAAVALNLGQAAAAPAALLLIGPSTDWQHAPLLGVLAAIAVLASLAELRLKSATVSFFDGSIVLALVALALAGPIAALALWVIPAAISVFVMRRVPLLSPGVFATVSSYALALSAGYVMVELAAAPSLLAGAPSLFTAGLAMWAVNFAFTNLTFAPFYQGYRPRALIRTEFIELAPAVMTMLAAGVATTALLPTLGAFALIPLTAVTLVPQLAFWALARSRSVARLSRYEATELYAIAIADVLRLSRVERELVAGATTLLARWEERPAHMGLAPRVPALSGVIALAVDERWDGAGPPFGIPASRVPVASRVLAVARAWSALTAAGTAQLPHSEAILDLAARAGSEFDPEVVDAAAQVVAEESAFVRDGDFEPRLHALPLPRRLRRRGLPAFASWVTAGS